VLEVNLKKLRIDIVFFSAAGVVDIIQHATTG